MKSMFMLSDIILYILDCYVVLKDWDYYYKIDKNMGQKFLSFGVLVGAFSIFRRADTGNPVQISVIFSIFTLNPFPEGLI